MTFPSPTKTWHNASYPAISPSNTALSVKGKTVFITGGGAGIGLAIACAFAAAGASTVAISGRTKKALLSAKNGIESAHEGVTVLPFVADVTDQKAVDAAFASVGKVDILVHNAGYLPRLVPISQSRLQNWWSGFETNVKGSFIVTQAFLRVAASDATLVDLTTGMVHLPALPLYSAYQASKTAELRFFDSVQFEYPEMHVVHIHPGVVATDMYQKTLDAGVEYPLDDVDLPAHFILWASSPEARFLKGKTVWANWDVEELKAQKAEIEAGSMLTTTMDGMSSFKYTSASK